VTFFENRPVVVTDINLNIQFQDLDQKIQRSGTKPALLKAAQDVFRQNQGIWQPAISYQWFECSSHESNETCTIARPGASPIQINPGHSNKFLTRASHVLAAVYTIGSQMDGAAEKASREGKFLDGHFLDLLGLLALEKTEQIVKQIAQEKAAEIGWGVSPFLSPGSVHGWDLEEQIKLASLLPIEKIQVSISDSGVFSPFKTISCIIGIGPGYEEHLVGTTCRVCSKREDCQMSHPKNQNTDY
jgi:hypothetical protein